MCPRELATAMGSERAIVPNDVCVGRIVVSFEVVASYGCPKTPTHVSTSDVEPGESPWWPVSKVDVAANVVAPNVANGLDRLRAGQIVTGDDGCPGGGGNTMVRT